MAKEKQDKSSKKKALKLETLRKDISSSLPAKYKKEVVPALKKQFNYSSVMEVPKLEKIVVNRGVGEATQDIKAIESTLEELHIITRQKPIVKKAKKSVANFKLRAGQSIGAMVTLRGVRMYAFLERLITESLPRIRDFKGLNPNSFDGRGNFTFGIREQLIFAEIDYNRVDKVRGFNVTIVTSAKTDEAGRELLKALDFPFRKDKN